MSIVKPATSNQPDFLPRVGAGCLMFIGVAILALSLTASFASAAGSVLYVLISAAFIGSGLFWYRFIVRSEHKELELREKEVLAVARMHNGVVSPAQLALETSLTSSEVAEVLARLSRGGMVRPELLDDGTVVYRFGGLLDSRS